jgi:hypothetical protein
MRGRISRFFFGFVVESDSPLVSKLARPAETLPVQPETALFSMLVWWTECPLEGMILGCRRKILVLQAFSLVRDPIS